MEDSSPPEHQVFLASQGRRTGGGLLGTRALLPTLSLHQVTGLRTVTEDELLQQRAADLLIGSQEDEPAHTDEGYPRYAARKQPADREEKEKRYMI